MTLPIAPPFSMGKGGFPPFASPAGTIGGGAVATRTLDLPLPELVPIPSAQEFSPEGHVDTAGIQSNITIPGITVNVPGGSIYVIRSLSLYINNMLDTTDVRWSIVVNGNPVPGWANMTLFPRIATFVGNNFDTMIRGAGVASISVIFTNADGGSYKVGAAIGGWFWPLTADQQWKNGGI